MLFHLNPKRLSRYKMFVRCRGGAKEDWLNKGFGRSFGGRLSMSVDGTVCFQFYEES